MPRKSLVATLLLGTIAASIAALPVRAGGDKVPFPADWAGGVMYMTLDRPVNPSQSVAGVDNIPQYREYYVNRPTIEALRKNEPVPSGTVVVTIMYKARLDAQGDPLKDANGRFIKGDLIGFGVMEKHAGWGAEYPAEVRNGEWEYQVFGADGKTNDKVKLATCFQCHKSRADNDFLFTWDRLKAAATR
jgi:hypothetical protein